MDFRGNSAFYFPFIFSTNIKFVSDFWLIDQASAMLASVYILVDLGKPGGLAGITSHAGTTAKGRDGVLAMAAE